MRKFLIAAVIAAALSIGVGASQVVAGSYRSPTQQSWPYTGGPACYFNSGAETPNIGSMTILGSFWDCNLWVADGLFSPRICVYAFDIGTGNVLGTGLYCTQSVQSKKTGIAIANVPCEWGHRYAIDSYLISKEGRKSQSATVYVTCRSPGWF